MSKQFVPTKKNLKIDIQLEQGEKSANKVVDNDPLQKKALSLEGNDLVILDVKPFKKLTCLEVANLGLEEFPIQLLL